MQNESKKEKNMKKNPMQAKKWGVMCHYLESNQNNPFRLVNEGAGVKTWDEHVNAFDVEKLARELYEMHAGYFMITLCQRSPYIIAPNATYDKLSGYPAGFICSKRDLVLDIYEALKKYDIDLYLYVPADGPYGEKSVALDFGITYDRYGGFKTNETFIRNWADVIKEYAIRYKGKVKGWWIDGCYTHVGFTHENLKIFYDVIKEVDENYMVAFNDGKTVTEQLVEQKENPKIYAWCPYEDYTAGETVFCNVYPKDSDIGDKQWHILLPIAGHDGLAWGAPKEIAYEKEFFAKYFNDVVEQGGAFSIDVALTRSGGFFENQRNFIKEVVESSNWWKNGKSGK